MARLFLQTLYSYRRQGKFRLHAFVLMPEHFHLLLTPSEIALERAMQFVKGGFSHAVRERLGNTMGIWERGFTDHRIRDAEDFAHHRIYIHRNPVARKLVMEPPEFRYCSAFPGFKLDPWPSATQQMNEKRAQGVGSSPRALKRDVFFRDLAARLKSCLSRNALDPEFFCEL